MSTILNALKRAKAEREATAPPPQPQPRPKTTPPPPETQPPTAARERPAPAERHDPAPAERHDPAAAAGTGAPRLTLAAVALVALVASGLGGGAVLYLQNTDAGRETPHEPREGKNGIHGEEIAAAGSPSPTREVAMGGGGKPIVRWFPDEDAAPSPSGPGTGAPPISLEGVSQQSIERALEGGRTVTFRTPTPRDPLAPTPTPRPTFDRRLPEPLDAPDDFHPAAARDADPQTRSGVSLHPWDASTTDPLATDLSFADPLATAPPRTPRPTPTPPPEPTLYPEGAVVRHLDIGLRVEGIMWSETDPVAVVNDRLVRVGDTVGGVKILGIEPRSLRVEYQGRAIIVQY